MVERMLDGLTEDTVAIKTIGADTPEHSAPDDVSGRAYILVFERGSSWVFELPRDGEVGIGRGDLAELRLRDQSVSRRHAELIVRAQSVTLRDLGSHNGTFIDGQRLSGERVLRSGDSIAVCAATLVLYTSAPAHLGAKWVTYPRLRERFEEELERSLRYQRPFTVMCGLLAQPSDHDAVNHALAALRGLDLGTWIDHQQMLILAPETGRDEAEAMGKRVRELVRHVDMRIGYAVCPADGCDADALITSARAAAASTTTGEVAAAVTSLRTYRIGEKNVIVADPAMARLYALVERLARVDLPVLITGETGSGKELCATLVHERSPRAGKQLVALNCAAIQENLVESELFGYERGAFSGAHATKLGLLEMAHGGTMFLDEIGELSLPVQAKLLRVLESKRLTRVGDVREREINLRLVAATNRNLQDEVDAGRFRQDLFFRLSGAMLTVPPLRDRKRELPLLADLFLAEACRTANRPTIAIAPDAHAALEEYRWPGNVRELKNVMDYMAATLTGDRLTSADLVERLGSTRTTVAATSGDVAKVSGPITFAPIADEIRTLEIARMTQALDAAGGNQTKAAELIGMPLRTFFTKMRQYNLRK
jgi:two-component system response regulator AtoC